jgi:hypothetical protein
LDDNDIGNEGAKLVMAGLALFPRLNHLRYVNIVSFLKTEPTPSVFSAHVSIQGTADVHVCAYEKYVPAHTYLLYSM